MGIYTIWALYDDAESSYKKGIKEHFDGQFNVHSIGINDKHFDEKKNYSYHRIDLSLNNFNLIEELKKLPKPDIILASPPCESWSGADCDGRMFRSIDNKGNWVVKNREYYENYNKKCHPVKRRYFLQKEQSRIIGESTIGATVHIIEHFKPKYWVIENPLTSKTWAFQINHWNFSKDAIMNKTYYSSYDQSFSSKPTIFKSNLKLDLKNKKIFGNKDHMARGSYSKRSAIPSGLVKELVGQIKDKLDNDNKRK